MHATPFAFSNGAARRGFLQLICMVSEGTAEIRVNTATSVIAAVLTDAPQRRMTCLGGRDGLRRSLGSLLAGLVALFLGTTFRATRKLDIAAPCSSYFCSRIAVSPDGSTLLTSCCDQTWAGIYARCLAAPSADPRVVLDIAWPGQLSVSDDGFVFIADTKNCMVHVLTPHLTYYGTVGAGQLDDLGGVCANRDVVAVTETSTRRVSVFRRSDGALLYRFGSELVHPLCICVMAAHCRFVVADEYHVSLFTVTGELVGHVGAEVKMFPMSVACSRFDELFVATLESEIMMFDATGALLRSFCGFDGLCLGIALCDGAVFMQMASMYIRVLM